MFRRTIAQRITLGGFFGFSDKIPDAKFANKSKRGEASQKQQQKEHEEEQKKRSFEVGPDGKRLYATGMDAISEEAWDAPPPMPTKDQLLGRPVASAPATHTTAAANTTSSSSSSSSAQVPATGTGSAPARPDIQTGWMAGAEWASIGEEFKGVEPSKFLKPSPDGFLTHRAVMDVKPAEELLADFVTIVAETYKGVDVRDPNTVTRIDGEKPKWLTMGGKVRAVSEFISGHLAHQVSLPVWMDIFDLKYMEADVMYWLWVIHLHIVARRATSVKIDIWSRRREVLEELVLTMFASWSHTSEEIMGRPPLSRIRQYIRDMYYVTAINLEEALMHDGPGGDLALLGVLVKFCPLPRPEDIPLYTYYTLIHYIRFHIALFDRISDEDFCKGNFNFFSPDDPAVFKQYNDCQMDEVIRSWSVGSEPSKEQQEAASEERIRTASAAAGAAGEPAPEGKAEEKRKPQSDAAEVSSSSSSSSST